MCACVCVLCGRLSLASDAVKTGRILSSSESKLVIRPATGRPATHTGKIVSSAHTRPVVEFNGYSSGRMLLVGKQRHTHTHTSELIKLSSEVSYRLVS